jgi:zinc transport system permease protein
MHRLRLLVLLAGLIMLGLAPSMAAGPELSLADILDEVSGGALDNSKTSSAPTAASTPLNHGGAHGHHHARAPHPHHWSGAADLLALLSQFRWALLGSVAAGFLCSLMGTLLLARRMMLLGIALPQAASAGITLLILAVQLGRNLTLQPGESPFLDEHTVEWLAPLGSLGAVLLVLGLLAWTERRSLFTEAQWATLYIMCAALVVLFLVINPYGEAHMSTMLEGNIITVTQTQFWILAAVAMLVSAVMVLYRKELLLTSFDPEMGSSLRFRLPLWNGLLYILLGVTVSTTVMITGPMFAFGYLLLPAFAARPWAVGMRQFYLFSTFIGVSSALAGCLVSFTANWPLGPTQVIVAGAALLLSRMLSLFRRPADQTEFIDERSLEQSENRPQNSPA